MVIAHLLKTIDKRGLNYDLKPCVL